MFKSEQFQRYSTILRGNWYSGWQSRDNGRNADVRRSRPLHFAILTYHVLGRFRRVDLDAALRSHASHREFCSVRARVWRKSFRATLGIRDRRVSFIFTLDDVARQTGVALNRTAGSDRLRCLFTIADRCLLKRSSAARARPRSSATGRAPCEKSAGAPALSSPCRHFVLAYRTRRRRGQISSCKISGWDAHLTPDSPTCPRTTLAVPVGEAPRPSAASLRDSFCSSERYLRRCKSTPAQARHN